MEIRKYIAIGDSFSEGYGDEIEHGHPRGWTDLLAAQLATAQGHDVEYANLAIRGRKIGAIMREQLEVAISMQPDLITINGGGNDIMRPRVSAEWVSSQLLIAARRVLAAGITPVVVSGANPSGVMPLGRVMQRRGDALANEVRLWANALDVAYIDNWGDARLIDGVYWSEDRLHLNARGHAIVAGNVVRALEVGDGDHWPELASLTTAEGRMDARYWRQFVGPWIGRRLTGRSSGDGRAPKFGAYIPISPRDQAA
ncbi:SGNH/GDSL hydrolase family protein [Agrococcus casei]|uniref:SGNH/GDSL hydrolase family protein n=1 Tax=Agrococcus casei TaxID=343512 RepID=UPI003F8DE37F